MSFVETAINSADIYYDYLNSKNKGIIESRISSMNIETHYVELVLVKPLRSIDDARIKIYNTIYEYDELSICDYDKDKLTVTVYPQNYKTEKLLSSITDYSAISIVSDLKFLIKRVKKWYEEYGNEMKLNLPLPNNIVLESYANNCDYSENQVNAITGALSNSLSYIWGAPGTGKTQFVLSGSVLSYLKYLKNEPDEKILIVAPTNNAVEQTLYGLLPILQENNFNLKQVSRLGVASTEFIKAFPDVCVNNIDIDDIEKESKEIQNKIDNIQSRINEIDSVITAANNIINGLNTELNAVMQSISVLNFNLQKYENSVFKFMYKNRITILQEKLKDKLNSHNQLENDIENRHTFIDKKTAEIEVLKKEKEQLISSKDNVAKAVSLEKEENIKIIATTLDTCFLQIKPPDYKIAHIFLDEAGYCPLIKAVGLLAYNCPITLLGDHMQLPPVCEMSDDEINKGNDIVSLWAQSAIHLESFEKSSYDISYEYINRVNPSFDKLKLFQLNYSYRFGEELAEILSDEIYANNLAGNENRKTNVFYINAPKLNDDKTRINISECEKIKKYLQLHPCENIGIITPYKSQKALLTETLNGTEYCNVVMTVHASQGKEWDTVILSVTDKYNKWFTNSRSKVSNGKYIINTAISRTKNNLIIVCDYAHWSLQKKQLIGKILLIAEEIEL